MSVEELEKIEKENHHFPTLKNSNFNISQIAVVKRYAPRAGEGR